MMMDDDDNGDDDNDDDDDGDDDDDHDSFYSFKLESEEDSHVKSLSQQLILLGLD